MNNYTIKAKRKTTGEVRDFTAIDEYDGKHKYGYRDNEGTTYYQKDFDLMFEIKQEALMSEAIASAGLAEKEVGEDELNRILDLHLGICPMCPDGKYCAFCERKDKVKNLFSSLIVSTRKEAYTQGRADEAKTCEGCSKTIREETIKKCQQELLKHAQSRQCFQILEELRQKI